jgi:hypothetical protein
MSIVNEGLLERIYALKMALEHLDRRYRGLKHEHSKCADKCKIKYLFR